MNVLGGNNMMSLRECVKNRLYGQTDKKPDNYYDVYESHFECIRTEPIRLLEIGVRWGGSIWGWRNYFPNAHLVGLDIDPNVLQYNGNDDKLNVQLYVGDQCDINLLTDLNTKHGPFDIIIVDGGHTMDQQLITFNTMWPLLNNGGLYIVEDTHTSYWPSFGGGYKRENTFLEFVKSMIDSIHAYHHKMHQRSADMKNNQPVNYIDHSIYGLHVYDSIIVIQKYDRGILTPIPEVNL